MGAERWVRQRRDDPYWKAAKRRGYRSRAAFKLQQIAARYGVVREGDFVLDLGCAPGGWTQAALDLVGPQGGVVGVDIDRVAPLPPARFVRGDMTAPETLQKVRAQVAAMRGGGPATLDAVISDMSPNISGVYSVDQARSLMLAKKALETARLLLRPGGRFVAKAFEGEDFGWLLKQIEASFAFVKVHSPPASRKASSEVYIVAKGFHRARGKKQVAREEE